jgi:ketopantoate reductase
VRSLSRCDDVNYFHSSIMAKNSISTVMREVANIAKALGYDMTAKMIQAQAERPVEVEAILGNALNIARKLGIETAAMNILYVVTKELGHIIEGVHR